jgi:hypothetical protein
MCPAWEKGAHLLFGVREKETIKPLNRKSLRFPQISLVEELNGEGG